MVTGGTLVFLGKFGGGPPMEICQRRPWACEVYIATSVAIALHLFVSDYFRCPNIYLGVIQASGYMGICSEYGWLVFLALHLFILIFCAVVTDSANSTGTIIRTLHSTGTLILTTLHI